MMLLFVSRVKMFVMGTIAGLQLPWRRNNSPLLCLQIAVIVVTCRGTFPVCICVSSHRNLGVAPPGCTTIAHPFSAILRLLLIRAVLPACLHCCLSCWPRPVRHACVPHRATCWLGLLFQCNTANRLDQRDREQQRRPPKPLRVMVEHWIAIIVPRLDRAKLLSKTLVAKTR